ncbi:MAG: uroporphyrinogen-III C-methyltransferase [Cryobacterium sp.]
MPNPSLDISLDVTGRRVLVLGGSRPARRVIARYLAAGALVYLAADTYEVPNPLVRPVAWPHSPSAWRDLVSAVDLVIAVDLPAAAEPLLIAACAERSVWLTRETAAPVSRPGHVTLVGGGPGDDDLLTVAALKALANADIVYYDRLGPHDRLHEWAPGADQVNVGKLPGHHAVPQVEIERMIVASALAGLTVVRLKGGDPFVFGRGGEEMAACRAAGVPVTVISGVTSAISVPALAGIPVTHRELSKLFTVLSGHVPLSEDELAHLVGLGGTIVVLMGVGTLPHLASGLARHGMRADMPVAIIERGFSAHQRTTVAAIDTVVQVAGEVGARSPAVLVIGDVVRLAQQDDATAVAVLANAATLSGQR